MYLLICVGSCLFRVCVKLILLIVGIVILTGQAYKYRRLPPVVTFVSLHFCHHLSHSPSLSNNKTNTPNLSSYSTKSCLAENLEEKLQLAKARNLDQPKLASHSLLVVSTVSFARVTMPNELVQVHLVRAIPLLVDGYLTHFLSSLPRRRP